MTHIKIAAILPAPAKGAQQPPPLLGGGPPMSVVGLWPRSPISATAEQWAALVQCTNGGIGQIYTDTLRYLKVRHVAGNNHNKNINKLTFIVLKVLRKIFFCRENVYRRRLQTPRNSAWIFRFPGWWCTCFTNVMVMFVRVKCLLLVSLTNSTGNYGRRCLTPLGPHHHGLTIISEHYHLMTSSDRFLAPVRSSVKLNFIAGAAKAYLPVL